MIHILVRFFTFFLDLVSRRDWSYLEALALAIIVEQNIAWYDWRFWVYFLAACIISSVLRQVVRSIKGETSSTITY